MTMSVSSRLEEWLRTMGCDGEMPDSFEQICGPSTSHIWEQLMTKVKPKQSVKHCRANLMVKRLLDKPLEKQDAFDFPIKEIDNYAKKQILQQRLTHLENEVLEKEVILDEILQKNKQTYFVNNHVIKRIEEDKEKIYVLNKKCELLENDRAHLQEVVSLAKNLTPVEMEESGSRDVTEILEKCAEKLKKIIKETPLPNSITKIEHKSSLLSNSSIYKTPVHQGSACKYFKGSTINRTGDIHSKRKINFKSDITFNSQKPEKKKINKRESLGLLPIELLDSCDGFDDLFLMPDDFLCKSNKNESGNLQRQNSNDLDLLDVILKHESIDENVRDLIHFNNRQMIIGNCEEIFNKLLHHMRNLLLQQKSGVDINKITKDDLTRLYFIHVKNELESVKYEAQIKKKRSEIKAKTEEVYSLNSTCGLMNSQDTKRILDLQIEEAILNANCNFLKSYINQEQPPKGNQLQHVLTEIEKINNEIFTKRNLIKFHTECILKVIQLVKDNREEAFGYVKRLGNFIIDGSWANPLLEEVFSNEIKLFQNFPLEYNRKHLRSVPTTSAPSYVNMDSNNFEMITSLIDSPFMPSESILLQLVQDKIKLNALKGVCENVSAMNFRKYSLSDLFKREKNNELDSLEIELQSLLMSPNTQRVLSSPSEISQVSQLWRDMFVKNYISDKRLVENKPYKFYEDKFFSLF